MFDERRREQADHREDQPCKPDKGPALRVECAPAFPLVFYRACGDREQLCDALRVRFASAAVIFLRRARDLETLRAELALEPGRLFAGLGCGARADLHVYEVCVPTGRLTGRPQACPV